MKPENLPKFLGNYIKKLSFPVIVVFYEKHGENMYFAEDLKELGKVFWTVVEGRVDDCFYEDKLSSDEDILTMEQIEALPKQYKEDALKKFKYRENEQRSVNENNRIYNLAKEAVKEKNGEKAFECLKYHEDWEYEQFEIKEVKNMRV